MTIYFSIIIIGILDYLQKYSKMAQSRNTFVPRICIKNCNSRPVIFNWMYEAINRWYTRSILVHVFGVEICSMCNGWEFVLMVYFSS